MILNQFFLFIINIFSINNEKILGGAIHIYELTKLCLLIIGSRIYNFAQAFLPLLENPLLILLFQFH